MRWSARFHELEQFGGALFGGLFVETVHLSDKAEVLRCRELAEERHALGDDPDLTLHLNGMAEQIHAENADEAGAGREQAGEHFDGGGFAGAVRTEKAEELAALHGEVERVNGVEVLEDT